MKLAGPEDCSDLGNCCGRIFEQLTNVFNILAQNILINKVRIEDVCYYDRFLTTAHLLGGYLESGLQCDSPEAILCERLFGNRNFSYKRYFDMLFNKAYRKVFTPSWIKLQDYLNI